MSVAVIESTTVSDSFLISCEVCRALRIPVTRISVRSSSFARFLGAGALILGDGVRRYESGAESEN
jgi:hypothetical protein